LAWSNLQVEPQPSDAYRLPPPGYFTTPGKRLFLGLVQVGDGLMRRQNPLLKHTDVIAALDKDSGSRGIRLARLICSHMRENTDAPTETWARLVAVDAGFPVPRVNHPITGPCGNALFYLDMAWLKRKTAYEYHGKWHFEATDKALADQARRNELQRLGWRVIEVTAEDLVHPDSLISRLDDALTSHSHTRESTVM
jgi:hypothetical protein